MKDLENITLEEQLMQEIEKLEQENSELLTLAEKWKEKALTKANNNVRFYIQIKKLKKKIKKLENENKTKRFVKNRLLGVVIKH